MAIQDAAAVWARTDRPLWLITAQAGARRGGMMATFVSPASIVPALPRVLIGIAVHHHTRELIEASGVFGLHTIAEEHLEWVWRFGLRSGRAGDKLAGLATRTAATGTPLLRDAVAWLDCRVEARLDTGDRTVYLAEVLDAQAALEREALSLRRFREIAPADKLRELAEQTARDSVSDAEAIGRWRAERHSRS
jgi:flavin reductase (DIM6/NTAB) family NADH-FMN oxidoreductase RutF